MYHAYALLGTENYFCRPIDEAVFAEGATQFWSTVPQFVPDDFRAAADAILMEQLDIRNCDITYSNCDRVFKTNITFVDNH